VYEPSNAARPGESGVALRLPPQSKIRRVCQSVFPNPRFCIAQEPNSSGQKRPDKTQSNSCKKSCRTGRLNSTIERYMQTTARKFVLMTVGVILLALGLGNTVPDVLRFFFSNTASQTLMISNIWVLSAICGALLCIISLFTGKKKV
jgi:hypothetical protein